MLPPTVVAVGAMMWRLAVLYSASLVLVGCSVDYSRLAERRYHDGSPVSCVDYPDSRVYDGGWRSNRDIRSILATTPKYRSTIFPHVQPMARRFDRYFPKDIDLVKEHAKLVQDINSLRQVMYVAPLADESRDYEDSIFPEIIETYTTTVKPTTTRPPRPTKGIPIILLGGASQRQIVRSQPIKFPKQVINLVGTSVSPLTKHPYPFVMQASSRQPVKICVTAPPLALAHTTRRPSLWERLISSIIPRSIIGASRPNLLPT